MAMTARETMQALLDGKTLMEEFNSKPSLYKLDDEGNLEASHNRSDWWKVNCWTLSHMIIYKEYSLTFEQALRAMLDGKVVEAEHSDPERRFHHRFNRDLSCFEYYSTEGCRWWSTHITECEQKAKWKVVE